MVDSDVLKFGEFTLKSGRKSPFFMNALLVYYETYFLDKKPHQHKIPQLHIYHQTNRRCFGNKYLERRKRKVPSASSRPGDDICFKGFVFSVIPAKDEESVGIKTIAFIFFTLFRTTVLFQKGRFLQKYRSTSE